mgnify:CR=1 FL=1
MSYFDNIEGRNQPDEIVENKFQLLRPKTAVIVKSTKNAENKEIEGKKHSLPAFIKITSKRPAEISINKT